MYVNESTIRFIQQSRRHVVLKLPNKDGIKSTAVHFYHTDAFAFTIHLIEVSRIPEQRTHYMHRATVTTTNNTKKAAFGFEFTESSAERAIQSQSTVRENVRYLGNWFLKKTAAHFEIGNIR